MYIEHKSLCVICKYFIPFCGLSSYFLMVSLEAQVFNVDKVHFILSFVACAVFVFYLRNYALIKATKMNTYFSSMSFLVLALTLGSVIHFACGYPVLLVPFVEKTILFPLNCLGTLSEIN